MSPRFFDDSKNLEKHRVPLSAPSTLTLPIEMKKKKKESKVLGSKVDAFGTIRSGERARAFRCRGHARAMESRKADPNVSRELKVKLP